MNKNLVSIFFVALGKLALLIIEIFFIVLSWSLKLMGGIMTTLGDTLGKIILKRS